MLYTRNGSEPAPMPQRVRLADGSTRTSLQDLTAQELAALGFVVAPDRPEPDDDEVVEWTGAGWLVRTLTQEEIAAMQDAQLQGMEDAVQQHLDATMQRHGYDSMLSCVSYVASTVAQFRAEAAAAVAWRDAVWTHCHLVLSAVMSGQRAAPTVEELLAEVPILAWPAGASEL